MESTELVSVIIFLIKDLPIHESNEIQSASYKLLENVEFLKINKSKVSIEEIEKPAERDELAVIIGLLEKLKAKEL